MITLLRSHQGASGKIRLARVGDNECQHDLAILFQDWASPGYQAAMIFFALLFFDWLFLRGNVTQAISNFIASALSG
ncbi:hypothetical protein ACFQFQ_11915 [Sulfitobacter porphyrae]|uniref:Uncharacterized protein n=1 Tax=Sulfitobacter porphyrae TaxID=1246864 RepID=A0ABW2B2Y5_9RHOB